MSDQSVELLLWTAPKNCTTSAQIDFLLVRSVTDVICPPGGLLYKSDEVMLTRAADSPIQMGALVVKKNILKVPESRSMYDERGSNSF